MRALTDAEKIKKYEEMIEKRKAYSKKHYYKNKQLVDLAKKFLQEQENKKK
jgi:hypothetical protein